MKFLKTLFVGGRSGFSLGRVAFWLIFGLSYVTWIFGRDIPPFCFVILLVLICYILVGKFRNLKFGPFTYESREKVDGPKPPAGPPAEPPKAS